MSRPDTQLPIILKRTKVKKLIFIIIFLLIFINILSSGVNNPDNLRGPQQYGVFFINEKPPAYFEDYYLLYRKRLYYNEDNIWGNIHFLLTAINSPFRHPSKALCLLKTEEEGKKYKKLLIMHLYLLIMKDYLTLGSQYDKKYIYYFNMPFKEDLIKSLNNAKKFYNIAKDFWKKVLQYSDAADKIKARTSIDYLEDELYFILNREKEVDWDYDYTIKLHLSILEKNLKKLGKN